MNETAIRNPGGRPSKLTREVAALLCESVGLGLPYRRACQLCGVSYAAFCNWRKDNSEFAEQLDGAIASGIKRRLETIRAAADSGDFRAAEVWLRLVLPAEYGRQRVELTGADGAPLEGKVLLYLPVKDTSSAAPREVEPLTLTEGTLHANGD